MTGLRCAHLVLFGLVVLAAGHAWAEKQAKSESAPQVAAATMALGAWRGSQIIGINVLSQEGKRVGAIADIVGDVKGQILYVILSQGGFLGIGDKMIPLPWWTIRPGRDSKALEIQLSAESLRKAPSFDSQAWPDFSQAEWMEKTDQYYQAFRQTKKKKSK